MLPVWEMDSQNSNVTHYTSYSTLHPLIFLCADDDPVCVRCRHGSEKAALSATMSGAPDQKLVLMGAGLLRASL